MNQHAKVDELLGAYALGAVPEPEATAVREHVAGCPECSSNLQRLAAVVAVLPLAIEPVRPPPSLRRRVMAAINDDDAGKILDLPSASGRGDVGRIDDLRLREIVRFGRRWVPSAAAAVVIAGLLSWNLVLQQQLRSPGRAPAAGSVATGTLTDARKAPMGTITYVAQGQLALISLHSLHHPSAGRIYELWLIEANGHVQGAGLFTPEADGTKVLLISHLIGARDKIAVTEEPLAGSQAPTSAPFISGHL